MLSIEWKDSKIQNKADKVGIEKGHKYRDRQRTITYKLAFINEFLTDYQGSGRSVLDISTGTGVFVEIMNAFGQEAIGTEIEASPYAIFHKSQGTQVIYHNSEDLPLPFEDGSFDLVTCIGAFNFYPVKLWSKILKDIFRISKGTIIVGANRDDIYEKNKKIFDKIPKDWTLTKQHGPIYRWDII